MKHWDWVCKLQPLKQNLHVQLCKCALWTAVKVQITKELSETLKQAFEVKKKKKSLGETMCFLWLKTAYIVPLG